MQEEIIPSPLLDQRDVAYPASRLENDRAVIDLSVTRKALVAALSAAVLDHAPSRAALKDAIGAYVDAMRVAGATPEGTLISVKSLAVEALAADYRSSGTSGPASALMSDIARWCITRFFR